MAANIEEIESAGTLPLREELLTKYKPTMLELLKLPGMGPKTVALLWEALQVAAVEELEAAIAAGRLAGLPRFGDKLVEKLRKGIEEYSKNSGRFHLDDAEIAAEKLIAYLREFPGVTTITPAGSLRRGRDTVGDLDILATGPACAEDKVSCRRRIHRHLSAHRHAHRQRAEQSQLPAPQRPPGRRAPAAGRPYGAALQYFTGSKMHNVSVRQRALKRGYTLSEYALARVEDGTFVAGATEEEIYSALGLDWIPPELRENYGEIEAAVDHSLPRLIRKATFAATSTCTPTPPTAKTPSAKWRRPASPAATNTSPSPTTPKISP